MNRLAEELIQLLKKEHQLFNAVLPVLEDEMSAARVADVQGITAATARKSSIVAQLASIENRRRHLLGVLSAQLNLVDGRELKLTILAEHVDPALGRQLRLISEQIKEVAQQIQQANRKGRLLMQHCQQLACDAISFLTGQTEQRQVYQPTGHLPGQLSGGHLWSGTI